MKHLVPPIPHCLARLLVILILALAAPNVQAEYLMNEVGDRYYAWDDDIDDMHMVSFIITIDESAATASLKLNWCGDLVTEINIPQTVKRETDGKIFRVTEIASKAFEDCSPILSITLPKTIEKVGDEAFIGCTSLESISLPASLTNLYLSAFNGCASLQRIEVEEGNNLFSSADGILYDKAGLKIQRCPIGKKGNVSIPTSVETIGGGAFYNCVGLTSIEIPSSVTTIEYSAFWGCTGLKAVEIPNSVITLGTGIFYGCTELTSVTLPNNIPTVPSNMFYGCSKLSSIEIPNSVLKIERKAFYGCRGLSTIEIPNSVTTIDWEAFQCCSGLKSIVIPNSVSAINDYAFQHCSGLKTIELSNSLKEIDYAVFMGCTSLTSVNLPSSITYIHSHAFEDCKGLVSISLPNSIKRIDSSAFKDCESLVSFKLPDSISKIESSQVAGCTGLKEVILTTKVLLTMTKDGTDYLTLTYFGLNTCVNLETLVLGDLESECEPIIELPKDFIKSPHIKSLTIGNIIKSADKDAFVSMPELSKLNIGKGWRYQNYASVEYLNTLQPIGSGQLAGATKLRSLTMPLPGPGSADAVGNFGELFGTSKSGNVTQYFEDGTTKTYSIPTTLEELTILEGCGMIPYGGLSNCNMLKKLTLPSTIYMVGEKALYGCAQLSDIYCMGAEPAVAYDNSFDGMRLTSCKLHVPYNSGDMYKEAEGWKRFRYIQEEAPIVISVTKNIENAGVVFGMDEYQAGQTAELRAVANSGYTFEGWYEGETLLTAEGTYAFTVLGNRELVAVFAPVADSNPVSVDAPGETATFMWPAVEDAASYTVTAYSDEAMTVPVVTVSLDASGNPIESRVNGDMSATLSGLSKETRYYYSISAFNANGGMLSRYTGAFTTGTAAIGEVSGDAASPVPAAYYNSQGIRSSVPWRGLNVVIYTDGSRHKLLID